VSYDRECNDTSIINLGYEIMKVRSGITRLLMVAPNQALLHQWPSKTWMF